MAPVAGERLWLVRARHSAWLWLGGGWRSRALAAAGGAACVLAWCAPGSAYPPPFQSTRSPLPTASACFRIMQSYYCYYYRRRGSSATSQHSTHKQHTHHHCVIVPICSTLRIYWFSHHTFFSRTVATENKSIRRLLIIINLLKFVVLSSLRCLVPVRFSIIVTTETSHYNISRLLSEKATRKHS